MPDQLPTNDTVAERQVIGACLLSPLNTINACVESLRGGPESFFDLRNRYAWAAILAVHSSGLPVCSDVVWRHIESSGVLPDHRLTRTELDATQDDCVTAAASFYCDVITAAWTRRREQAVWAEATSALQSGVALPEVIEKLHRQVSGLLESNRRPFEINSTGACTILADDLERRFNLNGALSGLTTGWSHFDRLTDGIQFGEQSIVAGRPSSGKSAIGINLVNRVCLSDRIPVLFVTLEMSVAALMRRLLSCNRGIMLSVLRSGSLTQGDMQKAAAFSSEVKRSPLHFLDFIGGGTVDTICASIRSIHQQHGIKLVIIDYLQKIRPVTKHEKRTYEVAAVSGSLKACAVETGAAFLTLAQLSREPERDKGRAPRLSDLADSSQIERDADLVALIHRIKTDDDPHAENTKLIIAKQRDGETGSVSLRFDGRYCKFENPPRSDEPPIPPSRTHADA